MQPPPSATDPRHHTDILDAALAYATNGWAVFPTDGKQPMIVGKTREGTPIRLRWHDHSTTNPDQIIAWYAGTTGLGIGIDLAKTNMVVADIDHPDEFPTDLRAIIGRPWRLHGNPQRMSLLYRMNGHDPQRLRNVFPWGDIRKPGNYIVLPPSPHPDGYTYEWLPTALDPPEPGHIPDALYERLLKPLHTTPPTPPPANIDDTDRQWAHDRIVTRQCDKVESAPDGQGNTTLNDAALIIGHYVPHLIDRATAEQALLAAVHKWAKQPPWDPEATIRSGLDAGQKEPQGPPIDVDDILTLTPHRDNDWLDDTLTDSTVAEKVAVDLRNNYLYSSPLGGWLTWTGTHWTPCTDETVAERVRRYFIDWLADEARQGADPQRLGSLLALQRGARIATAAKLCRGILEIAPDKFDAHPHLLNCANGTLDLHTGTLTEHNPTHLLTKHTPVAYDPQATHPDWTKALDAFPDTETLEWCQQFLGTGATGYIPDTDYMAFWHGSGSNGKSTVLGAIQRALGDYADLLLHTILGGQAEHPTEFMDLQGLRLGIVEELNDGHRLDVAKVKRILGTTTVKARKMHKDPVSFTATHTLVVTTNYRPIVTDTDHGTWRRVRMIPFPKEFGRDGTPKDTHLRHRLQNSEPQQRAVLRWIIDGARQWINNDRILPGEPQIVIEATREWRYSSDLLASFIDERCVTTNPEDWTKSQDLLAAFNTMLREGGHAEWSIRMFVERLRDHDAARERRVVQTRHRVFGRGFAGVRLRLPGEPESIPDLGCVGRDTTEVNPLREENPEQVYFRGVTPDTHPEHPDTSHTLDLPQMQWVCPAHGIVDETATISSQETGMTWHRGCGMIANKTPREAPKHEERKPE